MHDLVHSLGDLRNPGFEARMADNPNGPGENTSYLGNSPGNYQGSREKTNARNMEYLGKQTGSLVHFCAEFMNVFEQNTFWSPRGFPEWSIPTDFEGKEQVLFCTS
jgi:hypothetical protein